MIEQQAEKIRLQEKEKHFFYLEWEQRKILKILNNRKEFGEFFRH
jgi:hypothetical protein